MYESKDLDTFSKFNKGEAGLVKQTVRKLENLGVRGDDIGVVTPYKAQVNIIRKLLTDERCRSKKPY